MEELTFGQKAVSWNPKGYANPEVGEMKAKFAAIIDELDKKRSETEDGNVKRLCATAINNAETASMWAVKSLTWTEEK